MKKILITGAKGTIGTIIIKGLIGYNLTFIDLPQVDVRDYKKLLEIFPGNDVIIHLAWDLKIEDNNTNMINPDNSLMFFNVYKAAVETRVPRVIMASSVHTHDYCRWTGLELITTETAPMPDSPYGVSKVYMEAMGRYFSQKSLEVVCIRFGGITPEDRINAEEGYNKVYLSHRDCIELVRACINAPIIPNNFLIVHGVSNNHKRVHDYSNPLGWMPKDSVDDIK